MIEQIKTTQNSRGQRIWNRLIRYRDSERVYLDRGRLITEGYKRSSGMPILQRRAVALEYLFQNLHIYIDDEQLLAGDYSVAPMGFEWFPEFTVEWVRQYLENGESIYDFGPEDVKDEMLEICDYWQDKSAKEMFYNYLGPEMVDWLYTINEHGCWVLGAAQESSTEKGWNIPGFDKAISKGYTGIIAEIDEELATLEVTDDASLKKDQLLKALRHVLQAAMAFSDRYAALARELSEKESDITRKMELLELAEVCSNVPRYPARTFHEAVQSLWFTFVLTYWDTRAAAVSLGRVDQYLYPYYRRDIDAGILTKESALEILECLRVKLSSRREFHNATIRQGTNGGTIFHNCTLGGVTRDGKDAVNELSFLWLDAAERCRTPHPTLSVRWHERINVDFLMRAMEIVKLGMGFPAFFGDPSNITYLMNQGVPLEEARDYALGGCVLPEIPGKCPSTWPTVTNCAKIFEMAMHDGRDPRTGVQVGPHTGDCRTFHSIDQLVEAFQQQMKSVLRFGADYLNRCRVFRQETLPDLFVNAFVDDCIKKGRVNMADGARYQHSCMYMLPVGVVNVADSLAAIEWCVFDKKLFTMDQLLRALQADFVGFDEIQQQLLDAPKYGNDLDYVDHYTAEIYAFLVDILHNTKGCYGTRYECAPHNLAFHGAMGLKTGALPSGRKAGVALSDGAVSATPGSDVNGPSAMLNSAGKVDQLPIFGTLLNLKFTPSSLATPQDRLKLLSLIRTYFGDYGGKHVQFNVVDRETLLDAKAHPENYRNLIVRVSGYSALWVELNESIQNELIARTENTL